MLLPIGKYCGSEPTGTLAIETPCAPESLAFPAIVCVCVSARRTAYLAPFCMLPGFWCRAAAAGNKQSVERFFECTLCVFAHPQPRSRACCVCSVHGCIRILGRVPAKQPDAHPERSVDCFGWCVCECCPSVSRKHHRRRMNVCPSAHATRVYVCVCVRVNLVAFVAVVVV